MVAVLQIFMDIRSWIEIIYNLYVSHYIQMCTLHANLRTQRKLM